MQFEFEKSFVRDFKKLKNNELAKAIIECVQKVSDAETISDSHPIRF